MQVKQVSLFVTVSFWAILIGGIVYSHIVYFPPYLSHLPESTSIITGPHGLQEGNFWMVVHPAVILSTILSLILNLKQRSRRKFIIAATLIYVLALVATILYFLPELEAFANSNNSTTTPAEWYERGQTWQYLSYVRGFSMFVGFVLLLIALTKNERQ